MASLSGQTPPALLKLAEVMEVIHHRDVFRLDVTVNDIAEQQHIQSHEHLAGNGSHLAQGATAQPRPDLNFLDVSFNLRSR